jgi:hypothetical protein
VGIVGKNEAAKQKTTSKKQGTCTLKTKTENGKKRKQNHKETDRYFQ